MLKFYVVATTDSRKDPITTFEEVFSTFEEAKESALSVDLYDVIDFYEANDATEIYIEVGEHDTEKDIFETLELLTFYKFANSEWLSYEALAKKIKLLEDLKELLKSSEEEEAPFLLEELSSMNFDLIRLNSDFYKAFKDSTIERLLFELAYC